MPRRKKVYGNCPYCGEYDKLTKDHVIPECLFSENEFLPGDIPKVYACRDCNNVVKSANDRYFRDLLVVDMDSYQHPIAQELYAKFDRAMKRKQSEFATDITRSQQIIELFTQSGVFAEQAYTSKRVNQRSIPILAMMIRGLYRAYTEKILPQDTTFEIFRTRSLDKLQTDVQMLMQMGGRHTTVGNGEVFQCIYGYADDRPEISAWFLCFYKNVYFVAVTNHKSKVAKIAS